MTVSESVRIYEIILGFVKDKDKAKELAAKVEQILDEGNQEKPQCPDTAQRSFEPLSRF